MNKARPNTITRLAYILVALGISFVLTKPLITGDYFYPIGEYELYKSFLINFVQTLREFELPVWNKFVGNGHPAMYFGHYPLTQNTLIYLVFGYSDTVFYWTRFLNLSLMFSSFLLVGRLLGVSWLIALCGGLIYFSVNFVNRFFISDTLGNLVVFYPLLIVLAITIPRQPEKNKGHMLLFVLTYVLWLSGGNITYHPMHLLMLTTCYFASYLFSVERITIKKTSQEIGWYLALFIAPLAVVAHQYYFVVDVILDSNRLKPGLVVGLGNKEPWLQFIRSFEASSYFWVSAVVLVFYTIWKGWIEPRDWSQGSRTNTRFGRVVSSTLIITLLIWISYRGFVESAISPLAIGYDYFPIAQSKIFWTALVGVFSLEFAYRRVGNTGPVTPVSWMWLAIAVSLISHFFFSPENIVGDVNGYDYDLFRELSTPVQFFFLICVLLASRWAAKLFVVRVALTSLIVLYIFESHLTIPLMRFTGYVWYATRDGMILSGLFCLLFVLGMRILVEQYGGTWVQQILPVRRFDETKTLDGTTNLRRPVGLKKRARQVNLLRARSSVAFSFVMAGVVLVVALGDAHDKVYLGTSHRYIFPKNPDLVVSGWDRSVWEATQKIPSLSLELQQHIREGNQFSRVFTPENHYLLLAGNWQSDQVFEAGIYDSSISAAYQDFYDMFFPGEETDTERELKDVLPYFLFTRHVHAGLELNSRDIPYGDFFLFDPKTDLSNHSEEKFRLFLDLMQVKLILVSDKFSGVLDRSKTNEGFRLIREFPEGIGHLNLYETLWPQRSGEYAFLPQKDDEELEQLRAILSSSNHGTLRDLYDRLIFDADGSDRFVVTKQNSTPGLLSGTVETKVFTDSPGFIIHFDGWNKNWEYSFDGKAWDEPYKAFHIFRAIETGGEQSTLKQRYRLPWFRELCWLGLVSLCGLVSLLLFHFYKYDRKLIRGAT